MSDQTKRTFTTAFKERAVQRLEAWEQFSALAAELGVRRKLLYDWRKAWLVLGVAGLNRKHGPKPGGLRSGDPPCRGAGADCPAGATCWPPAGRSRFFSQSLAAHGRGQGEAHRARICAVIAAMTATETQGNAPTCATIRRLCQLGGVSRAAYYRHFDAHAPARADADLRDRIQQLHIRKLGSQHAAHCQWPMASCLTAS